MNTFFNLISNPVFSLPHFWHLLHAKYFADLLIQKEYNKLLTMLLLYWIFQMFLSIFNASLVILKKKGNILEFLAMHHPNSIQFPLYYYTYAPERQWAARQM